MKELFRHLFHRHRAWYYTLRPAYAITLGYSFYIFVTFALLCLPVCRKVSHLPLLDSLFTAVATISTTGLQTVNFAETYNFLGQCVVLLGIQIGGLGYMTLGSLVILASKGHLSRKRLEIGKAVLAMPPTFHPLRFLRHIVIFTLSIELIGALILWVCFLATGTPHPLWAAVFHSVVAFCTAGVSIFPNNLESFSDNTAVCLTVALLSLLGGIGFIVMDDLYRSLKSGGFRTTLTTRIILASTFGAVAIGTVFLFFDSNIAEFHLKKRLLTAFFQTVSALTTAGFNTIPISNLTAATLVVVMILMTLGASPSGTGGGLKSTTWSAAIAAILSFLRGKEEITFFNRQVPHGRITAAFASITLYLMTFALGTYSLLFFEPHPFEDVVFEVVAALGTTGLSHGITPHLTAGGKIVIMLLMFIGRLGVVSLALGAVALYHDISHEYHEVLHDREEAVGTNGTTPEVLKEEDIVL